MTTQEDQMPLSTSIRLDQETLSQLDAIAAAEGRSRSWLLQQAVKDALEIRASYEEAVQKGIDQARTGQFATEEELEAVFAKHGA
jgi:predicted transcriptional regulator